MRTCRGADTLRPPCVRGGLKMSPWRMLPRRASLCAAQARKGAEHAERNLPTPRHVCALLEARWQFAEADAWCREGEGPVPDGLDPKVVEVYTAVGKLLSRYSAGKVPKAFKIVPTLKNWEEVR